MLPTTRPGSTLEADLRRGGAVTTTVDHCTSPPFVRRRPYPIRGSAASTRIGVISHADVRRRGAARETRRDGAELPGGPRRAPGPRPASRAASSTTTSGTIPLPWIQVLSGVSHLAIVRRKPPLSSSSCVHCWTVPLPKVLVPTRLARPRSCSAPATISDAEADPPSTSTTSWIDGSVAAPPGLASVSVQVPVGVLLPEDRAVREELAGDVARRGHEPARVAAQVQDELPVAGRHVVGSRCARTPAAAWSEKPDSLM